MHTHLTHTTPHTHAHTNTLPDPHTLLHTPTHTSQVCTVVGGMATEKQERLLKQRPQIVVATPGRLWKLMSDVSSRNNYVSYFRFIYFRFIDSLVNYRVIPICVTMTISASWFWTRRTGWWSMVIIVNWVTYWTDSMAQGDHRNKDMFIVFCLRASKIIMHTLRECYNYNDLQNLRV